MSVLTHVLSVWYRKPSTEIKILHLVETIRLQFSVEFEHYLGRFPIIIVKNYRYVIKRSRLINCWQQRIIKY